MTGTETLWHPFAAMHAVRRSQVTITRAEDVWLWDSEGTRYLDATASLWYANAGHGRREIVDAVTEQLGKLDAYHLFTDFANEPALALADALAARAPVEAGKVFFTSGGGDSIDTAAKIARAYFALTGRPERTILLHREHSYHGTHGLGTSLAGIPGNRVAPPFVPDVVQTAWNDAEMLEETIRELGAERVAAFFCEPVIGAGGVLPPPPGYIEAAAEVCARHGVPEGAVVGDRVEGGIIDYLTPSFLGIRGADQLFRIYGRDTWGYPVGTTTHRFPTRQEA